MAERDRVGVTLSEWPGDVDSDDGVVINWFVREGGRADEGDSVCEIQIEKVSLDVYAPVAGRLTEVVVGEDGEFAAGDTLAWMVPDEG